ncbi:MAG TPA: iron-containing alcohol dehydrogenase [Candidatus Saccharimonadales bacterium]|nr:iron-containing alcohol dehydrogenase [Candidatus Saccharimonadales bacterium]
MNPFEFATAQQILFGRGTTAQLPIVAARYALHRCMVVTGKTPSRVQSVIELLTQAGIGVVTLPVPSEPSIPLLREAVVQAIKNKCDGVIAIGGGSVIDTGKAIAALMRNTDDLFEYLEVIGKGRALQHPSAPCIAIPTTSGTGAEVTRNAVLFSPEHAVKVSLRSATMLPVAAIVDPDLTRELAPRTTAWSGMDALTQLIEPYVSLRANPLTDSLCLQAIPLAARALPRAFHDGTDMQARTEMSLASLFGGMSLANSGLGVVHGFAGPLGGMFDAPHGAVCAAILPHGMAANIAHLKSANGKDATLDRYRTVARSLTGSSTAEPEDGVSFVRNLSRELAIPPLSSFGMAATDAEQVVEKSARASSMKANPVVLSSEELKEIFLRSL